jgi:hypothetical protein
MITPRMKFMRCVRRPRAAGGVSLLRLLSVTILDGLRQAMALG